MEGMTPEKVVEILKERNVNITLEQAKNLLDVLMQLCNLSIKQILQK